MTKFSAVITVHMHSYEQEQPFLHNLLVYLCLSVYGMVDPEVEYRQGQTIILFSRKSTQLPLVGHSPPSSSKVKE
jgi:hypothetical protein